MYTTSSPFADGGAPYLSAAFFNGLTVGNPATIWVHPTLGADSNNGTTPQSPKASIPAALAALPAAGGTVTLAAGTYPCAPFTLDSAKHTLVGTLGTKLDFTGMGSGNAITITGTAAVTSQLSVHAPIRDVEIIGPGHATSTCGLLFDTAAAWAGNVHQSPTNVNLHGFGTGIQFGSQAYMFTFVNTVVYDCGVGIWTPAGTTNAGERITFVGGAIQNCATTNVRAENLSGDLYFQSASFDYPTSGRQIEVNSSQVFLDGCHVEDANTNAATMFLLTGTGTLRMAGGELAQSADGGTRPAIVENDAAYDAGGALFTGVSMSNIACASGYFATGTGRTLVRDSAMVLTSATAVYGVSAAMNVLADGDMEGAGIIDDWAVTADTATVTNRTSGANIVLNKSTTAPYAGTQSLAAVKAGATGTNAQFSLPVPVMAGSKPVFSFRWAKPGSQTGTIYLSAYAARIRDNGTVLTVTNRIALKQVAVTLTSAANPWTLFGADAPKSLPGWATHVVFEMNLSGMGAGTFYVDAAHVSTI